MQQQIGKTFDTIGSAITSMGAVIFALLLAITAMIFFSHTLFLQVFPETMEPWEKISATWVMAFSWELTVLITTCNTRFIDKRIPWLMALASGVIVLFFIQAFDDSFTALQIAQRWFAGILFAAINYIYADLFYAKWQERNSTLQMPKRLNDVEAELLQVQSKLQQRDAILKELQAQVQEDTAELKELRALRKKVEQELMCPHCRQPQAGYGTLRAHQGHCSKNPKNAQQHEQDNNRKPTAHQG